ncbi:MAG: class I fructose-bisphosphate aldolase [Thermoplasmatota archaeon]
MTSDPVQLEQVARALVAPGKGILAADESNSTISKRFEKAKIESSEQTRRRYRQMLFTADGVQDTISGVILYDETIRQRSDDGTPFPDLLRKRGIVPGIKVDKGTKPLAGFGEETITEGLDGLRERFDEYHKLGAQFAKWRAVIHVSPSIPSLACLEANAEALARYAALAQEAGLVPIVEPEVLMDGDHTVERCFEVTEETLTLVFARLRLHRVRLEAMLLKPNMVIAGQDAAKQAPPEEVARLTIACLRRTVPSAVPGIVFLSGGQSDEDATRHLDLMNRAGPHPWELSFSYGRALQAAALGAWAGKEANYAAGGKAFAHRARMNSLARTGDWTEEAERAPSKGRA